MTNKVIDKKRESDLLAVDVRAGTWMEESSRNGWKATSRRKNCTGILPNLVQAKYFIYIRVDRFSIFFSNIFLYTHTEYWIQKSEEKILKIDMMVSKNMFFKDFNYLSFFAHYHVNFRYIYIYFFFLQICDQCVR